MFLITVAYVSAQGPIIRGLEQGLSRAVENVAERVIGNELRRQNQGGINQGGFNQGGLGRDRYDNNYGGSERYDNNYRDVGPIGALGGLGQGLPGLGGGGIGRDFDRKC